MSMMHSTNAIFTEIINPEKLNFGASHPLNNDLQFSIAVQLMTVIGMHFGQMLPPLDLAKVINCNPVYVNSILSDLLRIGLIFTIPECKGNYILSRPSEEINFLDIYIACQSGDNSPSYISGTLAEFSVSHTIRDAMNFVFDGSQLDIESLLSKISLGDFIVSIGPKSGVRKGHCST